MVSLLEQKIETQRENIEKGGWKKWVGYLLLGALVAFAVSFTLFKDFFLRKRLAEAKTDAAIAKEELIQDEVDDEIESLERTNEELREDIETRKTKITKLEREQAQLDDEHLESERVIDSFRSFDDVKNRVKWDDDKNNN